MTAKLLLKRGKEKPLLHHHPWIFSGAIARVENANAGDTVDVYGAAGEWLARASYNPRSQIAARAWTFARDEEIDRAFFKRRLQRAIELRVMRLNVPTFNVSTSNDAYRLVNAESDELPGLVVDRYADFLIVQFLTLGIELHKDAVVSVLEELWAEIVEKQGESLNSPAVGGQLSDSGGQPSDSGNRPSSVLRHSSSVFRPPSLRGIYERSDVDVRKKEGLPLVTGVLRGEEPPDRVEIYENGLRFWVEVKTGHKTGFYLDQRENRQRAMPYLRAMSRVPGGGEVLNAFAYTGAFGVYAAFSGATRAGATHVLNLDASAPSLELARANFALNGLEDRTEFMVADAFAQLRAFRDERRKFDAIILDPPKFVFSAGQMARALRGYKDINLLAFQLLRPGGILVTFSCSGLVSPDLFQKVVFGAAVDAKREGQIVEKLSQAPDHPILLSFPEAEYLKGLIVRVV